MNTTTKAETQALTVALSGAQRAAALREIEAGQPLAPAGVELLGCAPIDTESGLIQVDCYGQRPDVDDGYSIECVTVRGTRIEITCLLTDMQIRKLNDFADRGGFRASAEDRAAAPIHQYEISRAA